MQPVHALAGDLDGNVGVHDGFSLLGWWARLLGMPVSRRQLVLRWGPTRARPSRHKPTWDEPGRWRAGVDGVVIAQRNAGPKMTTSVESQREVDVVAEKGFPPTVAGENLASGHTQNVGVHGEVVELRPIEPTVKPDTTQRSEEITGNLIEEQGQRHRFMALRRVVLVSRLDRAQLYDGAAHYNALRGPAGAIRASDCRLGPLLGDYGHFLREILNAGRHLGLSASPGLMSLPSMTCVSGGVDDARPCSRLDSSRSRSALHQSVSRRRPTGEQGDRAHHPHKENRHAP